MSSLWALNAELTINKSLSIFLLVVLAFLVFQVYAGSGTVEDILGAFLVAGICLSIYAIFFVYGLTYFLGAVFSGQRLGQEISQTNTLGLQAATTIVLCFYYANFKNHKRFYLIAILPCLLCIATGSRSAILLLVIGIILLFYFKTGQENIIKFLFFIGFLAVIFYLIIQLPIFKLLFLRFKNVIIYLQGGSVNEGSVGFRHLMVEYGWAGFLNRPLLGHGIDCFRQYFGSLTNFYTYAHNNYIELLFDVES
jgi:hypothetical protein